jgi:hypothetical protein
MLHRAIFDFGGFKTEASSGNLQRKWLFGLFNLFAVLSIQDEITSANSCLMTIDLDSIFHKQNTAGKKSSIAKEITMLLSR